MDRVLPVGSTLGRYSVVGVLGIGGFGVTYLAEHLDLGSRVAIKEYMPRDFSFRADDLMVHANSSRVSGNVGEDVFGYGLERFLTEARALNGFKHAHIVRAIDYFRANGTAYIVMEYAQGHTLDRWLNDLAQRPNEEQLRAVFLPLLDGLRVVHEQGLLHRDIKPENIYIDEHFSPLLIDFGAVRSALGERTQSWHVVVTPGYSPKEQYASAGRQGPWTDVYAVGATMLRCLTGETPVDAMNRSIALDEGQLDPMPSASSLFQGQYSEGLLQTIDQCLRYSPDERPASARAVQDGILGLPSADIDPAEGHTVLRDPPGSTAGSALSDLETVRRDSNVVPAVSGPPSFTPPSSRAAHAAAPVAPVGEQAGKPVDSEPAFGQGYSQADQHSAPWDHDSQSSESGYPTDASSVGGGSNAMSTERGGLSRVMSVVMIGTLGVLGLGLSVWLGWAGYHYVIGQRSAALVDIAQTDIAQPLNSSISKPASMQDRAMRLRQKLQEASTSLDASDKQALADRESELQQARDRDDADASEAALAALVSLQAQLLRERPRMATLGSTQAEIDDAFSACESSLGAGRCVRGWFSVERQSLAELDPFDIDVAEVSFSQFAEFADRENYITQVEERGWSAQMLANLDVMELSNYSWREPEGPGSTFESVLSQPVVHVTFADAMAYCASVDARLPSRAEWEFAMRQGPRQFADYFDFERFMPSQPDSPRLLAIDVRDASIRDSLTGLYGGTGNVWEWTSTVAGSRRYIKGGSAHEVAAYNLRAAALRPEYPEDAYIDVGFRCARSLDVWPD